MKRRKAPGLSGIPSEAWKTAFEDEIFREKYRELLNKCLRKNKIPDSWRAAKLVLIHKPGKKEEDKSAYRPNASSKKSVKFLKK